LKLVTISAWSAESNNNVLRGGFVSAVLRIDADCEHVQIMLDETQQIVTEESTAETALCVFRACLLAAHVPEASHPIYDWNHLIPKIAGVHMMGSKLQKLAWPPDQCLSTWFGFGALKEQQYCDARSQSRSRAFTQCTHPWMTPLGLQVTSFEGSWTALLATSSMV
jgi:hypothetical protein